MENSTVVSSNGDSLQRNNNTGQNELQYQNGIVQPLLTGNLTPLYFIP
jgi:hypothetical protein